MKCLFDTSVLVASMIQEHEHHDRALPWLLKGVKGKVGFYIATHSLAELYGILTTYPGSPKLQPGAVRRLILEGVERKAKLIPLDGKDYKKVLDKMRDLNLSGGIIYDALIVQAAENAKIDYLLTFNEKHFLRVWPEGRKKIKVP